MEKEPLIITHEKKVVYVLSSHWVIQFSSFFGGMRMQTRIVKHLTKKKWHEKLEKKIDRNEIRIRRRKKNFQKPEHMKCYSMKAKRNDGIVYILLKNSTNFQMTILKIELRV